MFTLAHTHLERCWRRAEQRVVVGTDQALYPSPSTNSLFQIPSFQSDFSYMHLNMYWLKCKDGDHTKTALKVVFVECTWCHSPLSVEKPPRFHEAFGRNQQP